MRHTDDDMLDPATGRVRIAVTKALVRDRAERYGIAPKHAWRWYRARLSGLRSTWQYVNGQTDGWATVDARSVATDGRLR